MVDSKHQWKAWLYLLPAIILLLIFTVWPIINTVVTSFIYDVNYSMAHVNVEAADDGGYYFYRLGDKNSKNYLVADKNEDGVLELQYATSSKSSFFYNEEHGVWTTTVNDTVYFLGAEEASDLNVYALNDNIDKIGKTIYPAGLFEETFSSLAIPESAADDENEGEAETETEKSDKDEAGFTDKYYKLGVFKGTPEAYMYVKGSSTEGNVGATTALNKAAQIWPKSVKVDDVRGYKLYIKNSTSAEENLFIKAVSDEDGNVTLKYALGDGDVFFYSKEHKAWTCTFEDNVYYLALDNYDSRLSLALLSNINAEEAAAPAAIYMHRDSADGEAKEMTQLYSDDAYRIGAYRFANGTLTYLTDAESDNAGLRLTANLLQGDTVSKFGLQNFVQVLTDEGSDFMLCLKNTLILTVITVPISTVLALLIAVALNSIKALQRFLQTIFFLPYVTNSIAIGMVFAAMFNIVGINSTSESVGIINNILGVFGIDRINWINQGAEPWAAFTALIVYIVWNALPFKILILLGGLQSINKQYYDAAKVDGTPKWRVLLRITVPLLSPMITYTVITSFIGGFKEYSSVVGIFGDDRMVTGGSPNMNTIVGHIQDQLGSSNYGRAGAAALILFAIIFVVTMFNLWISKKSTHY